MGPLIGALLIAGAIFLMLRARATVGERWPVSPRRSAIAVAAVAVAVLVLIALSGSTAGILGGGVILGVVLYASWRLRGA